MFYYSSSANGTYSVVPSTMFTKTNYQAATFNDTTVTAQIADGSSYNAGVSAIASGSITYSLYDGSLPPGLELNSSTGAITGTPNDSRI
ncbi:MAG: putative Ig domain [Actinomycetota bacterium]|jgi:hypothetical protein